MKNKALFHADIEILLSCDSVSKLLIYTEQL